MKEWADVVEAVTQVEAEGELKGNFITTHYFLIRPILFCRILGEVLVYGKH